MIPCLAVGLEAGAELAHTFPDAGLATTLALPRTRAELGWAGGPLRARLGVGLVRSGGEAGYLGVDGEAIVPTLRVAEGGLAWRGFTLSAGAVDAGWVALAEARWGLPALAPSLGVRAGLLDGSDLGGAMTWAAPGGWLQARLELTAGEGVSGRELNDGKDVGAVVEAYPFAGRGAASGLTLAAYGRDGSRGLGSVRDDRAGAMVAWASDHLDAGFEGLAAWGVDGDATRTPLGAGAWVVARPWGPLLAATRADGWSEDLSRGEAGQLLVRAAAGVELRHDDAVGRLLIGVEHHHVGAEVAALAGAEAFTDRTTVFVHLSTDLDLRFPGAP